MTDLTSCGKQPTPTPAHTAPLAASAGVNPSQVIGTAASGVLPVYPDGNRDRVIIFNNVYVNQKKGSKEVYDEETGRYTIREKGTYEVDVNLNIFLLVLRSELELITPETPGRRAVLENLLRFGLVVWKKSPGKAAVQIAGKNGLFNRDQGLLAEGGNSVYPPGSGTTVGFHSINDTQSISLGFLIGTDKKRAIYVDVDDEIYVTLRVDTPPIAEVEEGEFAVWTFSVTSAGRTDSQEISGSFFNIQKIGK